MWWKHNKWRVIVPVLLLALAAFLFWYGGGAPGLQGWRVEKPEKPGSAAVGIRTPHCLPLEGKVPRRGE